MMLNRVRIGVGVALSGLLNRAEQYACLPLRSILRFEHGMHEKDTESFPMNQDVRTTKDARGALYLRSPIICSEARNVGIGGESKISKCERGEGGGKENEEGK